MKSKKTASVIIDGNEIVGLAYGPGSEKTVTRRVPITLTMEELVEAGADVSHIHAQLGQVRFEAKQVDQSYKDRLGGLQDDLSKVMDKLRTKKEMRDVDCLEVPDYKNRIVTYVYKGEIVDSRPLSSDELQTSIF
jgi:hypothetical protein